MLASRWQNTPTFHCTCFHYGWGRGSVRSALWEYLWARTTSISHRDPLLSSSFSCMLVWSCTSFNSNDTASHCLFVCNTIEPLNFYFSWGLINRCWTKNLQRKHCVKAKVYWETCTVRCECDGRLHGGWLWSPQPEPISRQAPLLLVLNWLFSPANPAETHTRTHRASWLSGRISWETL